MLKELIKAIYEIAKAIKGDNGNNGGGESVDDNGLYGADGIVQLDSKHPENSRVFLSQKELFDDFKENIDEYPFESIIIYLYTENNIDKLFKPNKGNLGKTYISTTFVNEYELQDYELISIQDYFVGNEPILQKIVEKLGNNVYVFIFTGNSGGQLQPNQ